MTNTRKAYAVNVKARLMDKWTVVLETDDIEEALRVALDYYNAGNCEALVWDNTRNGWYLQEETD